MKYCPRPIQSLIIIVFIIATCVAASPAFAAKSAAAAPMAEAPALTATPTDAMSFTVSMEQPSLHLFHVTLRCDGLKGETQDFKMPVWTPGYYVIMDYPKNVVSFRAGDGAGRALAWEKTAKNVWPGRSLIP
jgi:hypothetical protein